MPGISMGGNRKGKLRTKLNLMITMLLGGLWHGANWQMVFWGALHGGALVVHKTFLELGDKHGIHAENRVLKGWREQGGHRVPAKRSMVHGALQRAPGDDRWSSHGDMHYEKTSGPPPQGRRHCRPCWIETGASRAGNDCDAFCSAMERGQVALGKP